MKKRTRRGRRAMALVSTRKALGAWQSVVCDELKDLEEIIVHEWMHWYYREKTKNVKFYYPKISDRIEFIPLDDWVEFATQDMVINSALGIPGVGKTEITREFAAQHCID